MIAIAGAERVWRVVSIKMSKWPPATVRFATHEAARGARLAAKELKHIAGGIDTEYNERRTTGERMRPGWTTMTGKTRSSSPFEVSCHCPAPLLAETSNRDTGRPGVLETSASSELIVRAGLPKDVGGAGGTAAQDACTQQQRA